MECLFNALVGLGSKEVHMILTEYGVADGETEGGLSDTIDDFLKEKMFRRCPISGVHKATDCCAIAFELMDEDDALGC